MVEHARSGRAGTSTRINWDHVLEIAAGIVRGYDTLVTLRQLFYRLVVLQLILNTPSCYKILSATTADRRRKGTFPDLIDLTRKIHRESSWASPFEIITAARDSYRRDRTEGQDVSMYLGVEKHGMVAQLDAWFGDRGLPILAVGGYSSQTYVDDIKRDVSRQDRPAVLLFASDFDPSGEDLERDFVARTGCWDKVVRVALTPEQVRDHDLPVNEGKESDSRAEGFIARHGSLVQVELDALPPETLRDLYESAVCEHWNQAAYARSLKREATERRVLAKVVTSMRSDHR